MQMRNVVSDIQNNQAFSMILTLLLTRLHRKLMNYIIYLNEYWHTANMHCNYMNCLLNRRLIPIYSSQGVYLDLYEKIYIVSRKYTLNKANNSGSLGPLFKIKKARSENPRKLV